MVALAFLIAFLRGGRLRNLPDLRLIWLPPLAFALQILNHWIPGTAAAFIVTVVSYALLGAFVVVNAERQGLRILFLGMLLNLLAMAANGGRIPVDVGAARAVGYDVAPLLAGLEAKHVAMTATTPLAFLGDVIPVTFPVARVFSIGDIFIYLGVFLLIQELMGKRLIVFGPGGRLSTRDRERTSD